VSEILDRRRTEEWSEIRDELNRYLRGWANYFAYGSPERSFRSLDEHVSNRARNLLRRRHKLPAQTSRFGWRELHEEMGVVVVAKLVPKPHAFA